MSLHKMRCRSSDAVYASPMLFQYRPSPRHFEPHSRQTSSYIARHDERRARPTVSSLRKQLPIVLSNRAAQNRSVTSILRQIRCHFDTRRVLSPGEVDVTESTRNDPRMHTLLSCCYASCWPVADETLSDRFYHWNSSKQTLQRVDQLYVCDKALKMTGFKAWIIGYFNSLWY